MLILSNIRRSVALLVLVTLPAIAVARLNLDTRATRLGQLNVEAEHDTCCSRKHNHGLCVLLAQAPWSPTVLVSTAVVPGPSHSAPVPGEPVTRRSNLIHLEFARAPPAGC